MVDKNRPEHNKQVIVSATEQNTTSVGPWEDFSFVRKYAVLFAVWKICRGRHMLLVLSQLMV